MSREVRYREGKSGDAGAIAALHADSWRATYRGAYRDEFLDGPVLEDRMNVWQARLAQPAPNQHVVLAEDASGVCGFACAYGAEDPRWGTLLDNLHVRPGLHRAGIGRGLMGEVFRWSRASHPGCGLYLFVLEQNANARRFYESLGARDVELEISTPPGGGEVRSRLYAWPAEALGGAA